MTELDLGTIVERLFRGWKTPAAFAVVLVLLTLITLPFQRPLYSVHMLIMPAPADQNSTPSSGGGTLSTLLGIAAGGSGSNYTRYQALLTSNAVAQRMQDKYGMLQYVYRDYWDSKKHVWVERLTFRQRMQAGLVRLAGLPVWTPPDVTSLSAFLEKSLVILPSTSNDIIDISMDHWDVEYAKRIMLTAHEQANAVLRDQIARRAGQQVSYLQAKLAQTTVEDYRQTLLALLSSQEKTLMLTQTEAPFAAEIISAPTASPTPISPRPVLSVFVAVLVGLILGSGVVIFFGHEWWRSVVSRLHLTYRSFAGGKRRDQHAPE